MISNNIPRRNKQSNMEHLKDLKDLLAAEPSKILFSSTLQPTGGYNLAYLKATESPLQRKTTYEYLF